MSLLAATAVCRSAGVRTPYLQAQAVAHVQRREAADHVADGVDVLWVVAVNITQAQLPQASQG